HGRPHARCGLEGRELLSAAGLDLVFPAGVQAKRTRKIPAHGPVQGPGGHPRLPLRLGLRIARATPSPALPRARRGSGACRRRSPEREEIEFWIILDCPASTVRL